VRDLFDTDIREASVLTMYLLPEVNLQLRPRLLAQLKPGSRVISHDWDMGEWQPVARPSLSTSLAGCLATRWRAAPVPAGAGALNEKRIRVIGHAGAGIRFSPRKPRLAARARPSLIIAAQHRHRQPFLPQFLRSTLHLAVLRSRASWLANPILWVHRENRRALNFNYARDIAGKTLD